MGYGGNTWVAADPHFSHSNMIKFTMDDGVTPMRPFKTVEEMDETLIHNWNSVVGDGDRVYLLGDVAFHPSGFHQVIPQLKGRICLVPGNHEPPKMRRYFDLFDDVRGYVVKKGFVMSHIPLHPASLTKWHNIHGHLHHGKVMTTRKSEPELGEKAGYVVEVPDSRYTCVSMEQIDYTPKLLSAILRDKGIAG